MARKPREPAGPVNITLPHGWAPRAYQLAAWRAAMGVPGEEPGTWKVPPKLRHSLAWHRRAGKDAFALNRTAVGMIDRIGTYWHMLPQANQARKAIWDAVDEFTGIRRIDQAFPKELRETTRDHEMFIRMKNGSTWQLVGSDNYNSLVGSPPIGLVGSEWALADPAAWDFLRPILANNGGWAMFISTPRGENHFADMHRRALSDPLWANDWFAETLTVEDTGALSPETIARELRELAAVRGDTEARSIIAQEYYCSFAAALPGAYYAELLAAKEARGEIGSFPWDPRYPVRWGSDLGMKDSSTFWLWQDIDGRPRIINYFDGTGVDDVGWYVARLNSLPYRYGRGLLPHDGGHTRLGMAGSISAQMTKLGARNDVVPVTKDLTAAIQQTRTFLTRCVINTEVDPFPGESREEAKGRMMRALTALRMYHREWDPQAKRFRDKPEHDWCSDVADGLRTVACGHRDPRGQADPDGKPRRGVRIADGVA